MTAPVRLQLSRRKGFVLQAMSQATNGLPAVRVARPSRWGNPYPVAKVRRAQRESMDWAGRCTSPLWISWANSHFKSGRSPDLEAELDAIALTTAIANGDPDISITGLPYTIDNLEVNFMQQTFEHDYQPSVVSATEMNLTSSGFLLGNVSAIALTARYATTN